MARSARNIWEEFARAGAESYVLTARRDYGDPAAREFFFESGRREAREILAAAERWSGRSEVAVEFGCGVGRLAIPVSSAFERVVAIDVAPTMLAKLRENCASFGVTNVQDALVGDAWDRGLEADLVYSRLVFQHLEDLDEIESCLRRLRACLRPDGVAYLQFDTRPESLAYKVRNALPDPLLPRNWRRGIRRIRRSPETLRSRLARVGFAVAEELRPASEDHVFVLRAA